MKEVMKFRGLYVLLFCAGPALYGQAIPAGTISDSAPSLGLDGILHYSLNASEVVDFGYYGSGNTTASTVLSGNVAYTSKSQARPFSMVFAGGVILPNGSGQGGVTTYQNIAASQGWMSEKWNFGLADSFSFLPQSPTTGISGIAGVGDIGTVPEPEPGQGIAGGVLTYSGNRYANSLSGTVERSLDRRTSISGTGSWGILRFVDEDAGLDSSQYAGSLGVNRKLDARSSMGVSGVYSDFEYGSEPNTTAYPSVTSKAVNVSYTRAMSRNLSVSGSVGPQWVSSSNSTLVPSSLSAGASASASYVHGRTTAGVAYSRGVNAGSGVLPGAESDTVSGSVGHPYGREWLVAVTGSYQHSRGLTDVGVEGVTVAVKETFNTVYGGVQVSHSFSPHFSGYASYTVANQNIVNEIPGQNAFDGTSQTIGIGISFTPKSTLLGQF